MREIDAKLIEGTVKELCINANCHLPSDVRSCIISARDKENWAVRREYSTGSRKTSL